MGAITSYLPLFKLRICSLITFSAVVGFISAGVVNVSFSALVALPLASAILYRAWLKRRSWVNIIIGGPAGSFAVLAGGASATPELCAAPVLLAITMFFWTPSHFWSFAILHREDYEKAGVPMLPNVIGDSRTARWGLLNTTALVASSFLPFLFGYLGIVYAAAATAVGIYFIAMNLKLIRSQRKEIARANFRASMVYLGGLFIAVIADVYL